MRSKPKPKVGKVAARPSRRESIPAPVYAETVLAVNFDDAKKYFLDALLEIHYAHALMLARQDILTREDARALLRALDGLDRAAISAAVYDGTFEDLFFYVENRLSAACGEDTAGKMHTARSRNDIDLTLYRMVLRREILKLAEILAGARKVLLGLAAANLETLMPAYTHTQPAQPTTLAHYLMAAVEVMGRDAERLGSAFSRVNRSPMGACAITTTGFPIDRKDVAELLGFEGLQVNSYGAIAAVDYVTEAASAVAIAMVNLGKLVQDLLLWCTAEFGFLRLREDYVQTSSIMPQKRNPVSLEHTRILASKALGQAQAVLTCAHNTPFGDIVDSEDDLQPLVFSAFSDAQRSLRLFAGLMEHAEVRRERMRCRAQGSFLTATELADTLVRREGVSFRRAHQLVSSAVRAVGAEYSPERMVEQVQRLAPELLGHPLGTPTLELLRALDPENFVRIRSIVGGPAPSAVSAEIERARSEISQTNAWVERKRALLDAYPQRLRAEATQLAKP